MRLRSAQSNSMHCRTFRQRSNEMGFAADQPCGTLRASESGIGEPDMELQKDLSELERRHQALEREIQDERSHPGADDLKLAALKRRKLQLKDQIERLKHSHQRSLH